MPVATTWQLFDTLTGKLVVTSTSYDALLRECEWRDIAMPSNRYQAVPKYQEACNRWGGGRPHRFAAPWPDKKVQELTVRYLQGDPVKELEERFDAPLSSLLKRVRALGLPKRDAYNTQWASAGGHKRPWISQREMLVQRWGENAPLDKIAQELGRTKYACMEELRRLGYPTESELRWEMFKWLVEEAGLSRVAAASISKFHGHKSLIKYEEWSEYVEYAGGQKKQKYEEMKDVLGAFRDAGYLQKDIAVALGMNQNTVGKWMRKVGLPTLFYRKCIRCGVRFRTHQPRKQRCKSCQYLETYRTAQQRILPESREIGSAQ